MIFSLQIGSCQSQFDQMRHIFNKLDNTNDGILTYDNLISIDSNLLSKKEKEIYNLVLVAYFGLGSNINEPCSFDEFCQIVGQYESEQKHCYQQKEQQQSLPRESLERIPQFNVVMAPQQEELRDANQIVNKVINDSKIKGSINIQKVLGLHQRDSLETIQTKQEEQLSIQKQTSGDFITEQELSIFLDQVAQQGINLSTLLSNEQIQNHKKEIENNSYDNSSNKLISKLLLQDFDFTHSGNLNLLEKNNLLQVVKKEIEAHKQFLGMNLKIIGDYLIGRTLGFGKTSIVKAAVRKDIDRISDGQNGNNDTQVALKIIPYKPLTLGEQAYQQLDNKYCKQIPEIQVLYQTDNENIIKLMNSFEHIDSDGQKWNVLALNLCGGGSLQEYRSSTKISESICRYLFYHIVMGINYLHHMKIAHMDIRLENILIDNEGEIKIADLGSCVSWQDGEYDLIKAGSISGTISTMSPEMLQMDQDFSAIKSDCWQLGLVLYELLTGQPAFRQKINDNTVVSRIINCNYKKLDDKFSSDAKDLINHLICFKQEERYDTTQILNHKWFDKEMHKPAIAKGIIILQNDEQMEDVSNFIKQLMKQEEINTNNLLITKDIEPKQVGNSIVTRFLKLKCKTNNGIIFTMQLDQIQNDQDLNCSTGEVSEYNGYTEKLENTIITNIADQKSFIKITVFMNSGMLQSFQNLFRRLRYLILVHYNIPNALDTRHDENPAYEIVTKEEEYDQFQQDSNISLKQNSNIGAVYNQNIIDNHIEDL